MTLKHRAKNQENYLFTLAKFKENYVKDVQNDESIAALKSAQKLNECGNYLLFKISILWAKSSSPKYKHAGSICYALSVLLFVHPGQLLDTSNVLTKSYKKIAN